MNNPSSRQVAGIPSQAARRSSLTRRFSIESLEPRQLLAAEPIISEFLARNDGGLRDASGRSSDWIEIFNAGDEPIDLHGYHLTNDASQLSKWTFPSTNVAPGQFLVVFASGSDLPDFVDASGNPHTNFTLRRGGDYLALVAPDQTVVSEFSAGGRDFPEQLTNTSYGIAQSTTLIDGNSESHIWVPINSHVDATWRERDFDALANGFTAGSNSVGYELRPDDRTNFTEEIATSIAADAHAVYMRLEFEIGAAKAVSNLSMRLKYDNGFVAYLNGAKVIQDNAPANPSWFSIAPDGGERDSLAIQAKEFDLSQFIDQLVDGKNVLAIHGLNHSNDSTDMLLSAELEAGANDYQAAFAVPARTGYLAFPTPGNPNPSNDAVTSGFVGDTRFTVDRGFYDSPQQVEISTDTPGAIIYYSTDGSTPAPDNPSSAVYRNPLTIGSTTTLRAAAYRDDFTPSNVDTQTYFFLSDIVNQDFQSAIDRGFPETWGRIPAEYGLDPDMIGPDDLFDGKYTKQIRDSLIALPSLSIVTDFDNLFGETGILENTRQSGFEWERPVSFELIRPDGADGFQIDAGMRIQGDASREYSNSKKMSFRLAFRQEYGDTKLVYPMFGENATDTFDTIRLRANYNDGSVHTPLSTQQIRDEWMRRTLIDMGQPNSHGTFMHVYINGIYWGFYNVVERPDGSFSETYFGGDKDDWDTISANQPKNGSLDAWRRLATGSDMVAQAENQQASNAAYQRLLGNNPDGTNNPELEALLDVDNYIDYLIVNFYGGNGDWPGRNYYAGRLRGPDSTGFKFFSWDAEKVLGHEEGATVTANRLSVDSDVAAAYGNLRSNDEFRLRFADRVQKHFFHGGALAVDPDNSLWDPDFPERNTPAARYHDLAQLIELPLVAELARWGDTSRRAADKVGGEDRLISPDDWASFRDGLFSDYFPRRSQIVLDQFRSAGLYPTVNAPVFSQHGGIVPAAFELRIESVDGTVYFTTDGSDPRKIGGDISDTARAHTRSIALDEDTWIKARVLHDGEWSALTEARFIIASRVPLRITEINYDPHDANPIDGLDELSLESDQFEFLELMNSGATTLDLENVRLASSEVNGDRQGVRFTFAKQMLEPDERIVVVRDREAFVSRYGPSIRIAAGTDGPDRENGQYGGRLSNTGEQLTLLDSAGQVIQQFIYRPVDRGNGRGSTLEIVDPIGEYADQTNWRASQEFGGSPGHSGVGPNVASVVISEILASSRTLNTDQLELFNATPFDVSVDGWYISDSQDNYFASKIAVSSSIPAFGYHVLSQEQIGLGFHGSRGGDLWIVSADSRGRPLHFVDHVSYPPSDKGVSVGISPSAPNRLLPLAATTFGSANSRPRIEDIVISEVHYSPVDPDDNGPLRIADLEFVELTNTTGGDVNLTGWKLRGDVGFDFPEGAVLGSGESLVIVGFDPGGGGSQETLFRFTYAVPSTAVLFGPLSPQGDRRGRSGVLSDDQALIQLVRPGSPANDEPRFIPQLVVDQLNYKSTVPWPSRPAGQGDSLTRVRPADHGEFATSWISREPSPGVTAFFERLAGDANDDGQFDPLDITQAVEAGKYVTGEPASWREGDWNGDGVFDQLDLVLAFQSGRFSLDA